jgi:pimeloyl-ACP methyl ester carboxylesterase
MELSFTIGGRTIEAAWHGAPADRSPTLVLLHEGLGSVSAWKDFPAHLADRTGYGVLVYSRPGYGNSDPVRLPRPLTYMHEEALEVLPAVLDQTAIRKAVLVGHSDGASIAAIHAGSVQDFRIRGLVLMAPHFFVEDFGLRAVEAARQAYLSGGLRERLAKYHRDVDVAFWGWNRAWLDPAMRSWRIDDGLAYIRIPMLVIQGRDDPYGTWAQVEAAQRETYCPVDVALIEGAGHAPQVDRPQATLDAIARFVHRVLTVHEGLSPAA